LNATLEDRFPVATRLIAITGLEKGSGKTTFLNALLPAARRAGPVALFSIGVDGSLKARNGARAAEVRVEAGDIVLTTDLFARTSSARLEILDAPGGRSVLGHLLLGRVVRPGEVTLVGTEHLAALSETIELVRHEGWAAACLVDGSANRITQVSALGDAGFVFTVRADRTNLSRMAERLKALVALADLPVSPEPLHGVLRLDGPLTQDTLKALPQGLTGLSLEDFTKSFLPPTSLLRFLEKTACSVRRGFKFLGVVAALRDLTSEEFRSIVGPRVTAWLLANPYEVAAA
jgi:hypothetical protein